MTDHHDIVEYPDDDDEDTGPLVDDEGGLVDRKPGLAPDRVAQPGPAMPGS